MEAIKFKQAKIEVAKSLAQKKVAKMKIGNAIRKDWTNADEI